MASAVSCAERASTAAGTAGGIKQNRMSGSESKPPTPNRELRWYQYRLRTLLLFMTLCAFACSLLAVLLRLRKLEREASEEREAREVAEEVKHSVNGLGWIAPPKSDPISEAEIRALMRDLISPDKAPTISYGVAEYPKGSRTGGPSPEIAWKSLEKAGLRAFPYLVEEVERRALLIHRRRRRGRL